MLTYHERRRRNWTPSLRSRRQTASSEAPSAAAREAPSQLASPLGGGNSNWRKTRRRRSAIFGGLARPRPIPQPGQPSCRKPLAPQTHRIRPHAKLAANRVVPFALQASQNNLGPFHQASLLRPTSSQGHQFTSLLGGAGQGYRDPCHRTPQLVCSTDASYLISYINAIRH